MTSFYLKTFYMKNLLLWTSNRYGLWEWDVVSRSCKYQLEGYWQQSLHQLGKTDIFSKVGTVYYYLLSNFRFDNNLLIVVIWRIFTQWTRCLVVLDSGSLYKGRNLKKITWRSISSYKSTNLHLQYQYLPWLELSG